MTKRLAYRVLVAGQQHFACSALRAILSAAECSRRWEAAAHGATCAGCALGKLHYVDHKGDASAEARRKADKHAPCVRCGVTDQRTVLSVGLCVSCYNRSREKIIGRNSKGKPPTKLHLWDAEVAVQHDNARIERRLIAVEHQAEALARVLRSLPTGAKLLTGEQRLTSWNRQTRQFELVCNRCGTQGQILERVQHGGLLQLHARCCQGSPRGTGWEVAQVRRPVTAMHPETAAALLNMDQELAGETAGMWTLTPFACAACDSSGQLEGLLTAPSGRWSTRCRACGASSD